ncbi:hypothetical protein CGRA01v4_14885 [Colletotrichum graminicola]|nr:hypothetical protein CGRA01v4_14885 [Colletotrichum graminicola]
MSYKWENGTAMPRDLVASCSSDQWYDKLLFELGNRAGSSRQSHPPSINQH